MNILKYVLYVVLGVICCALMMMQAALDGIVNRLDHLLWRLEL